MTAIRDLRGRFTRIGIWRDADGLTHMHDAPIIRWYKWVVADRATGEHCMLHETRSEARKWAKETEGRVLHYRDGRWGAP